MSRARSAVWFAYLALGIAGCVAYLIGPLKGSRALMNLLGLSPVLAIVTASSGTARPLAPPGSCWRRAPRSSGSATSTRTATALKGIEVPFPSPGDAFYLAMYPLMMAGLLLLVRRRSNGEDRGGLVDGLVLTVGLALPSWVALIAPYLHAGRRRPSRPR